jgi:hypothetical protein
LYFFVTQISSVLLVAKANEPWPYTTTTDVPKTASILVSLLGADFIKDLKNGNKLYNICLDIC